MAKTPTRGLPDNFELDIPERSKAVELGDYMDEIAGPAPKQRAIVPPPAPSTMENSNVVEMPPRTVEKPLKVRPPKSSKKAKAPFRKQINATPQTLEMIDDLVDKVREESSQRDAKASEVFQALVLALYEAKEQINLQDIEPRGKWGTPMAQSFIVNLKGSFQAAIADHHKPKRK